MAGVKKALRIIQHDREAMLEVGKQEDATLIGLIIIAVGGALGSLRLVLYFRIFDFIKTNIITVVASVIAIGIIHVIAGFLGGKAGFIEFFRCASFACIIGWANAIVQIPFIGRYLRFPVSILSFLIMVIALIIVLETLHQLTRQKAAMVMAVPTVVVMGFMFFGLTAFLFSRQPEVRQMTESYKQIAEQAGEFSSKMAKIADHEPVDPVLWSDLGECIPPKLSGYQSSKLKGRTGTFPGTGFSTSDVKRRYKTPDGSRRLEISLIDSGYQKALVGMHIGWSYMGEEVTSEGYTKNIKINGFEGKLKWENTGAGIVFASVKDRFFLTVTGTGFSDGDEIVTLAKETNLKKLKKLD